MLQAFFHAWERQLAAVTTDRVVRPFEWGLEWIPSNGSHSLKSGDPRRDSKRSPGEVLGDWVALVMTDTDAFFTPEPTSACTLHVPHRTPIAFSPFQARSSRRIAKTTPCAVDCSRLEPMAARAT